MMPLAGTTIVEAYATGCNPALRLAGAMAGHILSGLGAQVIVLLVDDDLLHGRDADPALRAFLESGKTLRHAENTGVFPLPEGTDGLITDEKLHVQLLPDVPDRTIILSLFGRMSDAAPGSEFTVLALSGALDLIGDPAREPLKLGGHQAAYSAGISAATAMLAALCAGEKVQTIVSMLDTMVWINWKSPVGSQITGSAPSRQGSRSEWQVLRCADGYAALVYQESDWRGLCDFIGDDRLREPRFATAGERQRHARELAAIVERKLLTFSREEIRDQALTRRLPLGAVWSPRELVADRQYVDRDVFVQSPQAGPSGARVPCLPVQWDGKRLGDHVSATLPEAV
jgi:crotonobetainyl-CoA:carnitine CoA-transferase CaiB-like acyl-CoA transferase